MVIYNNNIIIINTGSIKNDPKYGRRKDMLEIIRTLTSSDDYRPKKIGIDLEYIEHKDAETDKKLGELLKKENCTIAKSKQDNSIFDVKKGYVNFPNKEKRAVRNYYNCYKTNDSTWLNSFANECLGIPLDTNIMPKEFYLKYYCKGKGFYNILNKEQELDTVFAFPAIEADTLLKLNGLSKENLKKLFYQKIVLIGHLGEGEMHNFNDITDKHCTPTDLEFIFKTKIMPGVVIHANAIKQLMSDDQITDCNQIWYSVIIYCITFYFFIGFIVIERLRSIFVRLFIELIFTVVSVLLINYISIMLLGNSFHINTFYIAVSFIFIIELKSFAMEYYQKKSDHKIK